MGAVSNHVKPEFSFPPKAMVLKQKHVGTLKHRMLALTPFLESEVGSKTWHLCEVSGEMLLLAGAHTQNHCPQESKNGFKGFSSMPKTLLTTLKLKMPFI